MSAVVSAGLGVKVSGHISAAELLQDGVLRYCRDLNS